MHAKIIVMQAGFAILALLGLVLLGHPVIALPFAGLLLATATGLLAAYVRARRAFGARPAAPYAVTPRRSELTVAIGWALACFLPAGLAILALATGGSPIGSPDPTAADLAFGALALATTVMLGSSLVDWYFTTPRLAGRVCLPPCLAPDEDRWLGLTQVVMVHRWLAAGAVIGGLLLALAVLLGALAYHAAFGALESRTAADTAAIAAVIAALLGAAVPIVAWTSGLMRTVAGDYVDALRIGTSRGLHPSFAVGQYVSVRRASGELSEGYVLDVSLEAIKLIPSAAIADGGHERRSPETIWVTELATASVRPARGPYCDGTQCRHMNETYCLRAQQLRERLADAGAAPDGDAAERT